MESSRARYLRTSLLSEVSDTNQRVRKYRAEHVFWNVERILKVHEIRYFKFFLKDIYKVNFVSFKLVLNRIKWVFYSTGTEIKYMDKN